MKPKKSYGSHIKTNIKENTIVLCFRIGLHYCRLKNALLSGGGYGSEYSGSYCGGYCGGYGGGDDGGYGDGYSLLRWWLQLWLRLLLQQWLWRWLWPWLRPWLRRLLSMGPCNGISATKYVYPIGYW